MQEQTHDELLDSFTVEQLQTILDCITKCSCICHTHPCMHFRACCTFTYEKFDAIESRIKAKNESQAVS